MEVAIIRPEYEFRHSATVELISGLDDLESLSVHNYVPSFQTILAEDNTFYVPKDVIGSNRDMYLTIRGPHREWMLHGWTKPLNCFSDDLMQSLDQRTEQPLSFLHSLWSTSQFIQLPMPWGPWMMFCHAEERIPKHSRFETLSFPRELLGREVLEDVLFCNFKSRLMDYMGLS